MNTSGHLADRWVELVAEEARIKNDKEKLRTMILLTNQNIIIGSVNNIAISTITANKFDSKEFQKNNPDLAKQYRMNVTSTRIDITKK
jgi:hypothetical protein